jgi:hypothetical protein
VINTNYLPTNFTGVIMKKKSKSNKKLDLPSIVNAYPELVKLLQRNDILELSLSYNVNEGLHIKVLVDNTKDNNFEVLKYNYEHDHRLIEYLAQRVLYCEEDGGGPAGSVFDAIEIGNW